MSRLTTIAVLATGFSGESSGTQSSPPRNAKSRPRLHGNVIVRHPVLGDRQVPVEVLLDDGLQLVQQPGLHALGAVGQATSVDAHADVTSRADGGAGWANRCRRMKSPAIRVDSVNASASVVQDRDDRDGTNVPAGHPVSVSRSQFMNGRPVRTVDRGVAVSCAASASSSNGAKGKS